MGFLLNGVLAVMFTTMLYILAVYPILNPIIEDFVANGNPTDLESITLQLIPFVMIASVLFSIISFINPFEQQQGRF